MVTLYDVARRAAVSTATVSRVVHGQDRVREATRFRVQRAIDELGYVPDGAQSLSRRRKDIIGMACIGREEAGQHHIEAECLLYYDHVQRGVQAPIRDSKRSPGGVLSCPNRQQMAAFGTSRCPPKICPAAADDACRRTVVPTVMRPS